MLEWQWKQLRLRRKYASTPAGFSDKEAEKEAVRQWKKEVEIFRKNCRYVLESDGTLSAEPFAGRKEELSLIRECLLEHSEPVVLYGIGGIGKSALAREYMRKFHAEYDHMLYLSFQTTMQNLITDDFGVHISCLHYEPEVFKNRRKYFRVKYEILWNIAAREKILMVIDDCNIAHDKDMQMLFSLPCHILVTSRRDPDTWGGCQKIHIRELTAEEEWLSFVNCYRPEGLLPEEKINLDIYRRKVQGHTLMMQQKLRNPESDFSGLTEFQKNLFRKLSLKKEEKTAMACLSIMPIQGIPKKMFRQISGVAEPVLERLEYYVLVQHIWNADYEDEMLFLHPIIAKAAKNVFHPSAENCQHMIRGMQMLLDDGKGHNTWNRTLWENQRLEAYVFAFCKAFPRPVPWLADAFDELATFLWIHGYFQESQKYITAVYQSVKEYYGECHQITGQIALRVAAVYHNATEYDLGEKWYFTALHILENCPAHDQMHLLHLSTAYCKVARQFRHRSELTQAEEAIEKALLSLKRFRDGINADQSELYYFYTATLPYYLLEKGKVKLLQGNLPEAERICREIFAKCAKDIRHGFRINEFMNFYVKLLIANKEYEKAEKHAWKTVERTAVFRGKYSKDLLANKQKLEAILLLQGKTEEAQKIREELEIEKQDFYMHAR